jgi:hypothetical protein
MSNSNNRSKLDAHGKLIQCMLRKTEKFAMERYQQNIEIPNSVAVDARRGGLTLQCIIDAVCEDVILPFAAIWRFWISLYIKYSCRHLAGQTKSKYEKGAYKLKQWAQYEFPSNRNFRWEGTSYKDTIHMVFAALLRYDEFNTGNRRGSWTNERVKEVTGVHNQRFWTSSKGALLLLGKGVKDFAFSWKHLPDDYKTSVAANWSNIKRYWDEEFEEVLEMKEEESADNEMYNLMKHIFSGYVAFASDSKSKRPQLGKLLPQIKKAQSKNAKPSARKRKRNAS